MLKVKYFKGLFFFLFFPCPLKGFLKVDLLANNVKIVYSTV